MKPIEEIAKMLEEDWPPHKFDPIEFLHKARVVMDRACALGGEYDPRHHLRAQEACNAYGGLAKMLLQNGYRSAALCLLTNTWNTFAKIQKEENQRIYRAGLGFYLTKIYLELQDTGAAIRWAMLTQSDDILDEHGAGGGAGRQILRTILGMTEEELESLNEIAAYNLSLVRSSEVENWSAPAAFAEDVVVNFALANPGASHLLAAESSLAEFPLTTPYFESLLESIRADHETTTAKGNALEDLATYLFMLIPSLSPRRNVKDEYDTFETDLVIRNLSRRGGPIIEILGRHFLVECKNWNRSVGVSEVGYFLYRMRLTHVRFGVIFAKSGITGNKEEERAARGIIRKAFHEDGSICVVVEEKDLETLLSQNLPFSSLLIERDEQVRFGKAREVTRGAL